MTTNFSLTVDQAIEESIRMAGGQPSQYEELRAARTKLNLLMTEWQNRGINLWKLSLETVTVAPSTYTVSLSSDISDVLDCVWAQSSEVDLAMNRMSYKDYLPITNKGMANRPTQFLVERLRDKSNITLWPLPAQTGAVKFWAIKRIDDITGPRDSIDAPYRFMPALVNGLAYSIFKDRIKGTQEDIAKLTVLKQDYKEAWDLAYDEDRDRTHLKIIPKLR